MTELRQLGAFDVPRERLIEWKSGKLVQEWHLRFPQLFDANDCDHASHVCHSGKLFWEWLGAILLHHTTGYLSLVTKYESPSHARKRQVLARLFVSEVCEYLTRRRGQALAPDLLMYAPDHSDCFFCEVKGPTDRIRIEQTDRFKELEGRTGKPISVIQFRFQDEHIESSCGPTRRRSRRGSLRAAALLGGKVLRPLNDD
jgi:hypothetical protein